MCTYSKGNFYEPKSYEICDRVFEVADEIAKDYGWESYGDAPPGNQPTHQGDIIELAEKIVHPYEG